MIFISRIADEYISYFSIYLVIVCYLIRQIFCHSAILLYYEYNNVLTIQRTLFNNVQNRIMHWQKVEKILVKLMNQNRYEKT